MASRDIDTPPTVPFWAAAASLQAHRAMRTQWLVAGGTAEGWAVRERALAAAVAASRISG